MLLKFGSLLLVVIITAYSLIQYQRNKSKFSRMLGALVSLFLGVSAAVFAFITIQSLNNNLVLSGLISLLFSIGGGFVARRLIHLDTWMNVALSALIGSLFGFLIGYVTFIANPPILIADVIFIVFVYVMLQFSDKFVGRESTQKTAKKKKKGQPKKTIKGSTVSLTIIFVIFGAVVAGNFKNIQVGAIGQPKKQTATQDDMNNLQEAIIHVTPSGLNPKNSVFIAKTMMKVTIVVDPNAGENLKLSSEELKLNMDLKEGENIILLDNPLKGSYPFTIEPKNFSGTLIVK